MNRPDEGGGSSDFSAISVGSMAAMVTDLEGRSKTLQSQSTLKRRAGEFGIGMTEFQNIIDVGKWIDNDLPMLRRRVSLAKALEQQAGPGLSVFLDEPVKLPSEADLAKMRALAKKLNEHNSTDAEGARLYHEAALALAANGTDPDLMSAFFAELGPQRTQMLPSIMSASGSKTAADDMKMFSKAFGTASKDTDPPQGLVTIMNQFKQPPMHDGHLVTPTAWGRLALLQEGDFDPKWLTDVVRANGLDTFGGKDREHTDFRGGSTFDVQATGLPEDVVALAFGALKNNPEAARSAIDSMGPMKDTVKLVYGYAKSVGTGDSVADNFGLAVEAGTGSTSEQPGQHSDAASKFAYEFILASGQHKEVPWPIKDSLSRVAASYSHEMLTGGRTDDGYSRTSGFGQPKDFNDIPGVTPAFYLNPEDTYKFLHGFADNDQLSEPFDEAMGNLYNTVTWVAARRDEAAIKDHKQDPENWELAHNAFGSLSGLQYQSQLDVRGAMDESDKKLRQTISTVLTLGIGKVPTPQGFAAKYAWKGLTFAAKKGLKQFVKGGETRVGQVEANDDQMTLTSRYTVATQLVDAEYPHSEIPADIRDANGKLLSIDQIAKDQNKIDSFDKWTDSNTHDDYNFDNKASDGQANLLGGHKQSADLAKGYSW
jgi:hypothetical protein